MNITELKGIGAKTAENFNRLSVYTVSDLVGLYPRDYDVYHEPVFVKDISCESAVSYTHLYRRRCTQSI